MLDKINKTLLFVALSLWILTLCSGVVQHIAGIYNALVEHTYTQDIPVGLLTVRQFREQFPCHCHEDCFFAPDHVTL